jgi:hypothetical protein
VKKADADQFCYACGFPMGPWREGTSGFDPRTGLPIRVPEPPLCTNVACYRHRPDPGKVSL